MTSEEAKEYFRLLKEKHEQTDWKDRESIKEYNRYVQELKKQYTKEGK